MLYGAWGDLHISFIVCTPVATRKTPEFKIEISQNFTITKIFPGPIGLQVRLLVGSAGPVTVVETTKPH